MLTSCLSNLVIFSQCLSSFIPIPFAIVVGEPLFVFELHGPHPHASVSQDKQKHSSAPGEDTVTLGDTTQRIFRGFLYSEQWRHKWQRPVVVKQFYTLKRHLL